MTDTGWMGLIAVSAIFGFWLGCGMLSWSGGNLNWQQQYYQECLDLGAPQQNCLEKYLLPHPTTRTRQ